MVFGTFHYEFVFVRRKDKEGDIVIEGERYIEKVCITCSDTVPALCEFLTRKQLEELDKDWGAVYPMYAEALKHFPQGDQNEKI